MSLKFQIHFTVRRMQQTQTLRNATKLPTILARCPPVFLWLQNVTILLLYLENNGQNDSLILRCPFWVVAPCIPEGYYRLIESLPCPHLWKSTVNIRIESFRLVCRFCEVVPVRGVGISALLAMNHQATRRSQYECS